MSEHRAGESGSFFGNGFFDWQFSSAQDEELWLERVYNPDKYWGGFPNEPFDAENYTLPGWAVGPFEKYAANPIFRPAAAGWDSGHFGGGVHNGSVIYKDGKYYYIYRGECPLSESGLGLESINGINYICDIGIAVSDNGVDFVRDAEHSPLFRRGEDIKYSFEDVNIVRHDGRYYLFCNRWDWDAFTNPAVCGTFLAVSDDLLHWEKIGIVFPQATEIHRNGVVLQNPQNEAVRVNGQFIMYLNNGLIAYSPDLIHWESKKLEHLWPGGEGCFALADYSASGPDNILLFTGGHHTGHFYAIGEVLFSKKNPEIPLEFLPRPVIHADADCPWEAGLSADEPHLPVSHWRDTIFFTGLILKDGQWRMYYGGSEYYTCLATAKEGSR